MSAPLIGIITVDHNGRFAAVDDGFCRQLGHNDSANLMGRLLTDVLAIPSHAAWALNGGISGEALDVVLQGSNGESSRSSHAVAVRMTEHSLPGESFKLMMVSSRRMEPDGQLAHLGAALQTWVAVIDALPACIALLDAGGRVTSLNGMWKRTLAHDANGMVRPLLPGAPYAEGCHRVGIVTADDAAAIADGIGQVIAGDRETFSVEIQLADSDIWHLVEVVPLDRNAFDGAVVVHTDITERKRAEAARIEERNFVQSVIDSLPGIFYLINERGGFDLWNRTFEEVTGDQAEERA